MPTSGAVPEVLRGAWRREWIRYANAADNSGSHETEIVLWLQFEREMVDVRFPADQSELAGRGSLANCDMADLLRLANSDSSSGYTTCSDVELDDDGNRTATAEWFSDPGVSFQPFTSFPEPGLLEWNGEGTVMMERAPSGAYVEEWHLVPGTAGGGGTIDDLGERTMRFTMGPLVVEVDDRRPALDTSRTLSEQIRATPNLDAARALVDCEFTLAERNPDGSTVVVASTHPWRVGELMRGTRQ